eukprot:1693276-Alexandrium_andersonii.AAC.1
MCIRDSPWVRFAAVGDAERASAMGSDAQAQARRATVFYFEDVLLDEAQRAAFNQNDDRVVA